jgi:hypothetical protein
VEDNIPGYDYFIFGEVPNTVGLAFVYISHKETGTTLGFKLGMGMFLSMDKGLTTEST